METGANTGRPVPDKAVQHVLYGMVAIFVRHDRQSRRHLFLAGQAVVLLKIEKQILHVRIRQSAGIPAPAQIPHNVHPVSQKIQADRLTQERVMAEHRPTVADGVGGLAFLRDRQAFPHFVNALLRR